MRAPGAVQAIDAIQQPLVARARLGALSLYAFAFCMTALACGASATRPAVATRPAAASTARERLAEPARDAPDDAGSTAIADAYQALKRGRYQSAERAFLALGNGPDRPEALLGLARVQMRTGRYRQAAETARRAVSRAGRHSPRALTAQAEALLAQGENDRAEKLLYQAAAWRQAHRARVVLGRLLQQVGRRREAEELFSLVIDDYNDQTLDTSDAEQMTYLALAAWALGSLHDANHSFREAALLDPASEETQLWWARLFLEKNDIEHARESVTDALSINPSSAEAHELIARILLAESFDFPGAHKRLDRALRINPKLVAAHVTRAGMALRNMQVDRADQHLERALSVNPNDLEALSTRAAVRFLADDRQGFEQAEHQVLLRNPRFSAMYNIIASYAEWEHRYQELIEMARKALRLDPDDAAALATLGLGMLRVGEEEAGLRALRSAWERDPFNVRVFNTLNLYEQVIAPDYERFTAPPFRIRLLREERAVLEPYLVPLLQQAYRDMKQRYRFEPEGPIDVELYADRRHFSVRTTGLPSAGVQGVCFGKVLTAVSPRAGSFNWGQIVWHELSHVFHLQISRNRVPRWFTEGLAEYETTIARPEWKREQDHELYLAIRSNRFPRLAELNTAFTGARDPQQLMTAYYVASRVVRYIVERFGLPAVVKMLDAWGKGAITARVFSETLGVDLQSLDADFRRQALQRLAGREKDFVAELPHGDDLKSLREAVRKAPDDADALAELALGYVRRHKLRRAASAARKALRSSPDHPTAHFALTRVALGKADIAAAEGHLRAVLAAGKDGYLIRLLLARASLARNDLREAERQLESAVSIDPERADGWQMMMEIAGKRADSALLLRAARALADIDQHDRRTYLLLMGALADEKQWGEVIRYGERALFVDPENPEVHRLLGVAYLESRQAEPALRELDQALRLGHARPGRVELQRARALLMKGQRGAARRAAERARANDPALSPAVRELFPKAP